MSEELYCLRYKHPLLCPLTYPEFKNMEDKEVCEICKKRIFREDV